MKKITLIFLSIVSLCFNVKAQTNSWQLLGPGTMPTQNMGRINTVWVNPSDYNHVLAGSAGGGLYKTINGGANWQNISDPIGLTFGISSVVVDRNNYNIIFLGTDNDAQNNDGYGEGLFKTNDGGSTWQKWGFNFGAIDRFRITAMKQMPNSNTLVVATKQNDDKGKLYLVDMISGAITDMVIPIINAGAFIRDLEFDISNPSILYAAGDRNNGELWKTTTGAGSFTWTNLKPNLIVPVAPSGSSFISFIAPNVSVINGSIYIMTFAKYTNGATGIQTLQVSTDQGATFTQLNATGINNAPNTYTFEVSQTNSNIMYAGQDQGFMFKSIDGGNSFFFVSNSHVDIRAINLVYASADGSSDVVFLGNDGGISKTTTGASIIGPNFDWQNINGAGLNTLQFFGLSGTPAKWDMVAAGAQDNGAYTYNGASNGWAYSLVGDAYDAMIAYRDANKAVIATNSISNYLHQSTNGGTSWPLSAQPTGEPNKTNRPMQVHPDGTMYIGYQNLWKSTNDGNSWSKVTINAPNTVDAINAFVVASSDPNVIYISYISPSFNNTPTNKFLVSEDGGVTFDDISQNLAPNSNTLGWRVINTIAVNPDDSYEIWIGLNDFEDGLGNYRHVQHSLDGGATFENISFYLPSTPHNYPINKLYYNRLEDKLYAGTDNGIWTYSMAEHRMVPQSSVWWESLNAGLPPCRITDIEATPDYCAQKTRLRISTYGRGIWETTIDVIEPAQATTISGNTTWTTPQFPQSNITIPSGAVLTVKSTVGMPALSKIIVQNGGTLIVDGGTLTACSQAWYGVNAGANAIVKVINGGTISNASTGILSSGLGKLQIDGGIFTNNEVAITVSNHHFFLGTQDYIQNSTFTNNQTAIYAIGSNSIYTIGNTINIRDDGNGIFIGQNGYFISRANTFISNNSALNNETVGINGEFTSFYSLGDNFTNLKYGVSSTYSYGAECLQGIYTNCYYGVKIDKGVFPVIKVKDNQFTNCAKGVFLKNINDATISYNGFLIPARTDTTYGVYILGGQTNILGKNEFGSTGGSGKNVGIIVWNGGTSLVECNTFHDLFVGCVSSGDNKDYGTSGDFYNPYAFHAGLKILQNTFTQNATDIYVAPGYEFMHTSNKTNAINCAEYPQISYGISSSQGYCDDYDGKYNPAGNIFSNSVTNPSTCANNSIVYNPGGIINWGNSCATTYVYIPGGEYYYNNPAINQTPQTACYSNSNVFLNSCTTDNNILCDDKNYNAAPPAGDTGGGFIDNAMISINGVISIHAANIDGLIRHIDGGNTGLLLNAISGTIANGALKKEMLAASPYLSDNVIIALINRPDPLPASAMRDILIKNSPLTNNVLLATQDKLNTYPNGIKIQLNNAQTGISARKKLENNISNELGLRQVAFGVKMRRLFQDTIHYDDDTIIDALKQEKFLNVKSQLIEAYIKKGDYTSAQNVINDIDRIDKERGAVKLYSILLNLAQNNLSFDQMALYQKEEIIRVADANNESASYTAQAILQYLDNRKFREIIELPDNSAFKTQQPQSITSNKKILLTTNPSLEGDYEFYCTPNPSNTITDFYYNIRESNAASASLEIYNVMGQKVISTTLAKDNPVITIETPELSSGIYLCNLVLDGVNVAKCKLIISK